MLIQFNFVQQCIQISTRINSSMYIHTIVFVSFETHPILNNYHFTWGNTWVKDLLHNPSKHLFRFPLAIWLTLGKGKTTITHAERIDLLCKWMIHAMTLENGIQFRKVRVGSGQYNWRVTEISPSFHENAAEHYTAMPDEAELQRIRQHFSDAEYYSSHGYHNRRNRQPVTGDTHQISMN